MLRLPGLEGLANATVGMGKMSGYEKVKGIDADGWSNVQQPVLRPKVYRMSCCDCGLVHDFDFRVEDGHVRFRVRRNNRATGQIRGGMRRRREGVFAVMGAVVRECRRILGAGEDGL